MNSIEIKDENADFANLLSEDELFADYFNKFCEINFYPEKLFYCIKSKQLRASLTGDTKTTNQNGWKVVNEESFFNAFKTNWLKYFVCSYQCLEYRLSKLLAQVCIDPITHRNASKIFQNISLSTPKSIKEGTNNIRMISPCWEEFEDQKDELVKDCNKELIECSDDKYVDRISSSGDQMDKFITSVNGSADVKREIIKTCKSNKVESEMINLVFESTGDVIEFYDFLPEVTAQPLWLFWIETQKIQLMEKCHDWYSVGSAIQKLRNTCYLDWHGCWRLKRLLERFCTFSTWSMEQLMPVADGVLHCLLTYWAPRYLLNKRNRMKAATSFRSERSTRSKVCVLCKYAPVLGSTCGHICNNNNNDINNYITMETARLTKSSLYRNVQRRIKTAPSFQADKISCGGGGDDDGREDSGYFCREMKSCDIRHSGLVKGKNDDTRKISFDLKRIVSLDGFVGGGFYNFLNESKNKEWLHGYRFLKECRRLKNHSDLSRLTCKASEIYARFLDAGSIERLQKVEEEEAAKIHSELRFPRVEMFEELEGRVTRDMSVAMEMFRDVVKESLSEVTFLKTPFEHQSLDDNYDDDDDVLINSANASQDSPFQEKSTNPTSKSTKRTAKKHKPSSKTPIVDIRSLHRNKLELENFKNFLAKKNASTDYYFWVDIEAYNRSTEGRDIQEIKVEEIFSLYINDKYYLGSEGPASKQQLEQNSMKAFEYNPVLADKGSVDVFLEEAQKCVERRIETKWMPLYLAQCDSKNRKPIRIGRKDTMHNKTEIINNFHKHSKDLQPDDGLTSYSLLSNQLNEFYFRQLSLDNALLDNFTQFVALKDDKHKTDVQFLTEIHKYEELCSNKVEVTSIHHKVDAIVNCFLLSQFPPYIKISIDQELADKIQNKSKKPAPNLFDEAKKTLLARLSKYFGEFDKLRNGMTNQDLFLHLSDERKKERALKMRSNFKNHYKESIAKLRALRKQQNKAPSDPLIDMDTISWTYSEHLVNLLNTQLKQEEPKKQPDIKIRPPWRI